MRYEEFPPAPDLRAHVRCLWRFEADAHEAGAPERIVPDGRCEMVLHHGDPFVESAVRPGSSTCSRSRSSPASFRARCGCGPRAART
jgi:hypothetical protein